MNIIDEPIFTTDEARVLSGARTILKEAQRRLERMHPEHAADCWSLGLAYERADHAESAIFEMLNAASSIGCPISNAWLHRKELCPVAHPPKAPKDQPHAA